MDPAADLLLPWVAIAELLQGQLHDVIDPIGLAGGNSLDRWRRVGKRARSRSYREGCTGGPKQDTPATIAERTNPVRRDFACKMFMNCPQGERGQLKSALSGSLLNGEALKSEIGSNVARMIIKPRSPPKEKPR